MKLAIKGHPTRGNEVIALLEMLGGDNIDTQCRGIEVDFYYYIDTYGNINYDDCLIEDEAKFFTLDEFYEKYPFKVGDIVKFDDSLNTGTITNMSWHNEDIVYRVQSNHIKEWKQTFSVNILKKYTDMETKDKAKAPVLKGTDYGVTDHGYTVPEGYEFVEVRKDFAGRSEIVLRKIQPIYPKTIEECYEVLEVPTEERFVEVDNPVFLNKLIISFTELLITRNAYWKIAGEEMGLDKPWEPDWNGTWEEGSTIKYVIYNTGTYIVKEKKSSPHFILAFPTEELRDAFYENFKDLIEQCKELL